MTITMEIRKSRLITLKELHDLTVFVPNDATVRGEEKTSTSTLTITWYRTDPK